MTKQQKKKKNHVNLIFFESNGSNHYATVTNLNGLFSRRYNKSHRTRNLCFRCFSNFGTKELLDDHVSYCSKNEIQRIEMPKEKDKILKFKNHQFSYKVPFYIVADFESLLKPCITQEDHKNTRKLNKAYDIIRPFEQRGNKTITLFRAKRTAGNNS